MLPNATTSATKNAEKIVLSLHFEVRSFSCSSRGLNLLIFLVLGSNLTGMVSELSGNEVGSKLKLVEHLASEGIGLGVTGDRSATGREFDDRFIVIGVLVVDRPNRAAGRHKDFLCYLTLIILFFAEIVKGG